MTDQPNKAPRLSIVVILHNMRREAPRTIYSLSSEYQQGVDADDYELIVVENGSSLPLTPDEIANFPANASYHFYDTQSVSPVGAIQFGMSQAQGEFVALIVDGARMVTPGKIAKTLGALEGLKEPFICSLAWHLGPDEQRFSMQNGYDRTEEGRLLASINWKQNGYRLFEISTLAPSSRHWFKGGMPSECSFFAMRKSTYDAMGGYDIRFVSPGGGLMNHDFVNRLWDVPGITPVVLLGEGSFHQMHGGVATNSTAKVHPFQIFKEEYEAIHQRDYMVAPSPMPFFYGEYPVNAAQFISEHQK